MPIGYLIAVGVTAAGMLLAARPLGRSGWPGKVSWLVSAAPNESPFIAFYWVLGCTLLALAQGDLDTPVAWVALALAAVSFLATPLLVMRGLRARLTIERALARGLEARPRTAEPAPSALARRLPWARILFAPLPLFRRNVRLFRNIAYGDAGKHNRLDLYRHRSRPEGGPILVHLHGGHFRGGRKSFEARALFLELASRGWVCISANYRLQPSAAFPDYVVDAKRVIAWAREHARDHGADAQRVFVAGSSAGAHIALTAALTANDPTFQPGFERADTSVSGAIGMYGWYGSVDGGRQPLPSSPADYAHPGVPPLLVVHGDQDTYVPPEHVRGFVEQLRRAGVRDLAYAELPGAQHSFDLFHSIRFETLINGIEAFRDAVAAQSVATARDHDTSGLRRVAG